MDCPPTFYLIEFGLLGHQAASPGHGANIDPEVGVMLLVLGLIDVVMIANLLIMVIVGGYETFVSRLNLKEHPDQPESLSRLRD